jgi:hypothetical protein
MANFLTHENSSELLWTYFGRYSLKWPLLKGRRLGRYFKIKPPFSGQNWLASVDSWPGAIAIPTPLKEADI